MLRHFTELSTRNFGVDTGFYPLGSCTMKYNPRVNERLVGLPGLPRPPSARRRRRRAGRARARSGSSRRSCARSPGLDAVSLQPAAGSQGELTGLLRDARALREHAARASTRRNIVIPDTAHGTNPASVTMAGYQVTHVRTDARGNIDLDDLREKVDGDTAGLMLTNPSTLGLFDENIEEIRDIFHGAGALMYYDGANLNAVCGISRPGRHGLRHRPHQPAQDVLAAARRRRPGRRPDRRPRAASRAFLPRPVVVRDGDRFRLDYDRPRSIGKVRGFAGPVRRLRPLLRVHARLGARAARDERGRRC